MTCRALALLAAAVLAACGIASRGAENDAPSNQSRPAREAVDFGGGKYHLYLDVSETPELREWAEKEIVPMAREWYPKLVEMLPSPGYQAPTNITIEFSPEMRGVAATSGNRIRCAAKWFRANLKGEAKRAVLHELVHVVQNYGRGRRHNPDAKRNPGWLVEGIADYIRWFQFEPDSKGAEITKRNIGRARYDGSYRITANFLNWVEEKNPGLVKKLNAAAREGKYEEELWKENTGKTLAELGADWKEFHEQKLHSSDSTGKNTAAGQ